MCIEKEVSFHDLSHKRTGMVKAGW